MKKPYLLTVSVDCFWAKIRKIKNLARHVQAGPLSFLSGLLIIRSSPTNPVSPKIFTFGPPRVRPAQNTFFQPGPGPARGINFV